MNNDAPRVFVIQQPSVFDSVAKRFLPKHDLSPARHFGKLVLVLGPGNIFQDQLNRAIVHMRTVFASYTVRDYLLAIGDPVAIAAGAMIAGEATNGRVNLLKWDRHTRAYSCFSVATKLGESGEKAHSNGT